MKRIGHKRPRIGEWIRGCRGRPMPAVILGGSVNGLSFVRSLARRSVPTLLLDSERLVGTYTAHGEVFLLPDADRYPGAWLELLGEVGSELEDGAVMFATSDTHAVLMAEHEAELRRHFRFIIPGSATMERIVNKRAQYEVARAAGTPIPATFFPSSPDEAAEMAEGMSYPCILKPYKAHLARKKIPKKVAVVRSPGELTAEYRRLAGGEVPYMIQEIIPGEDTELYGYLAFWDAEGEEYAWLTKRKLRQNPPHYGDGSLQVTVEAPEVAALSRVLLRAFDYKGFVGVEFKRDARDGTFRLMEINPRTVSGNQLAVSAGIDFPWLGYQYLSLPEASRSPIPAFQPDVKYVNEEWDFKAFLALRKSGDLTFKKWVGSLRGVKARAILAWDDPWPLAVVAGRFVRAAFRRFVSRGSDRAKKA